MTIYSLDVLLFLFGTSQSYPAPWDPMDCNLPGSSVHEILQARILEWVTIPFSRRSSQPRDQTWVSCIADRFFTIWATREALFLMTEKYSTPVRTRHGTTDWFHVGKGAHQGCILSPCLFNLYAEYIMQNVRLNEAQAGIKTVRSNISNLRYAD